VHFGLGNHGATTGQCFGLGNHWAIESRPHENPRKRTENEQKTQRKRTENAKKTNRKRKENEQKIVLPSTQNHYLNMKQFLNLEQFLK
jgi:hypothetical protein